MLSNNSKHRCIWRVRSKARIALASCEVGVPLSRDQQVQARISVDLGTVPFGSIALPALRNYLLSFIFSVSSLPRGQVALLLCRSVLRRGHPLFAFFVSNERWGKIKFSAQRSHPCGFPMPDQLRHTVFTVAQSSRQTGLPSVELHPCHRGSHGNLLGRP